MAETDDTPTTAGRGGPRRPQPRPFATRARLAIWLAAILGPWVLLLLLLRLAAAIFG